VRASAALIVVGYVALMVEFGWAGAAAAAAHLAILGLAMKR
jgi:hypothetical protein